MDFNSRILHLHSCPWGLCFVSGNTGYRCQCEWIVRALFMIGPYIGGLGLWTFILAVATESLGLHGLYLVSRIHRRDGYESYSTYVN
jgi:hypothetical protein